MPPSKYSVILESATIHSDGDQVNITCQFRDDSSPSQGCVIVSHKSTESVLMVKSHPTNTNFPVKLNVSETGKYFVAVFGWSDGVIELLPVELQQVDIIQGNLYY